MDKENQTAAEKALEDSRRFVDFYSRVSYAGNVRPDISKADPDIDVPEDERDDEEDKEKPHD